MTFDDLDEALDEQEQEQSHDSQSTEPATASVEPTASSRDAQTGGSTTADTDWKQSPGFAYDMTSQEAIYPREEIWTEVEQMLQYDVERELVTERGHDDISKRELHDALLRVALDHQDEIADAVESARRD